MKIRVANIDDAKDLFELNEIFNGAGNNIEHIKESLTNNEQEIVFIALIEDKAIGFCCVQLFKSMCYSTNYVEITELFVMEEYRHQGIGMALMRYVEEYYINDNIDCFQLFTGGENYIAQSFYEKNGYYKTSEIMYRKRL